jgi:hypothetical protein
LHSILILIRELVGCEIAKQPFGKRTACGNSTTGFTRAEKKMIGLMREHKKAFKSGKSPFLKALLWRFDWFLYA